MNYVLFLDDFPKVAQSFNIETPHTKLKPKNFCCVTRFLRRSFVSASQFLQNFKDGHTRTVQGQVQVELPFSYTCVYFIIIASTVVFLHSLSLCYYLDYEGIETHDSSQIVWATFNGFRFLY